MAVSYTHLDVYKRQGFELETKHNDLFNNKMLSLKYGGI